ncbi:MAG: histidinol-phosphatase HisJ family protein [Clostridia bacterium]|nr:histidinol-phosphatase HisJ family protein [Clostridia bacterium]
MATITTVETPKTTPLPSPFATEKTNRLSDYHLHTEASFDCKESIYNVCAAAIKAGLREICITDHYDCGYDVCRSTLEASYPSIERAAMEFGPELTVKRGLEVGEATQCREDERYMLENYKFDCLLASLHNIRGNGDFYFMDVLKDPEGMIRKYFEELIEMCETCDFDVLAHLTYPLRYKAFYGIKDLSIYDKEITRIFRLLIDAGRGLEINTGGLRIREYNLLLPTEELLKYYKSLGGEIITFGSDAHEAASVAYGFDRAVAAAKAAGFKHYAVYTDRVPTLVEL